MLKTFRIFKIAFDFQRPVTIQLKIVLLIKKPDLLIIDGPLISF